jgi:hypothetical protein
MIFEEFRNSVADLPECLAQVDTIFSRAPQELEVELMEAIDRYKFKSREWAEAFACLNDWLTNHSLQLSLRDQIAYLCCTAELADATITFEPLRVCVIEMLSKHGCERATSITARRLKNK